MSTSIKICLIFVAASICLVNSARILAISHMNSYSHFIISDRILQELAVRGHEVTLITPFEQKSAVKNIRHVVISDFNKTLEGFKSNLFNSADINFIEKIYKYHNMGLFLSELVLNNTNVQHLLNSNAKFDLVIHEKFVNDAFSGFSYHYNAPSIIINPTAASHRIYDQMGGLNNPSYIRDTFTDLPNNMSFSNRIFNFIVYLSTQLWNEFVTLPKHNELMQKYYPGAPELKELYYNTSLAFVNSHPSINPPIPLVPNIIDIGGYHVQSPKPLPKGLRSYLDGSKNGVVLFSMGSNLASNEMPEQLVKSILNVFAKVSENVLWKWDSDIAPVERPPNVRFEKWLPQEDVLAHPNIKLFITQCGVLSLIEAVYYGVPIFAIPVFGDQGFNAKNAEFGGYALAVPYQKLTNETFETTLKELLRNPAYSKNAKKASIIMRDQLMPPLDRAIYWIEYVIRHKGAPHLKTAALHLNWYQYLLIDVVAFITIVTITIVWMFVKIVSLLCCSKNRYAVTSDKKRK